MWIFVVMVFEMSQECINYFESITYGMCFESISVNNLFFKRSPIVIDCLFQVIFKFWSWSDQQL